MNITISDDNSSLKYIQSNNLILTAHHKKAIRTTLIHCAIAISLITYDIVTFNDWSWKSGVEPNVTYFNFHLGLGIGIAYLLGILANLRQLKTDKYKFISDLHATAKRHFSISNKQIMTITDEFIRLDSEVVKYEYKWTIITSYMVIDNFILLLKDSTFSSAVLIDKNLLNDSDLNELMTYLSKNKPETKEFHKPI